LRKESVSYFISMFKIPQTIQAISQRRSLTLTRAWNSMLPTAELTIWTILRLALSIRCAPLSTDGKKLEPVQWSSELTTCMSRTKSCYLHPACAFSERQTRTATLWSHLRSSFFKFLTDTLYPPIQYLFSKYLSILRISPP
jgi:hypothetical protein